MREFNLAAWGEGASPLKITPAIENLNQVGTHYRHEVVNPVNWVIPLANDDSPRQWMRALNLREIYRFKDLVTGNPALVNNASFATDDLIKARSLSGTFWEIYTNNPSSGLSD